MVLLLAGLCFPPSVHAQPDEDQASKQHARYLIKKAMGEYDVGHFERAAQLLEEAYGEYPYAEALFNLGQAHRQLKHFERALFYYRSYLRNRPDAANGDLVRSLIAEIEGLVQKQKAVEDRPPPGMSPPAESNTEPVGASKRAVPTNAEPERLDDSHWYQDTTGWVIVAAGMVAVAGAGVLQTQALAQHDDAKAALSPVDAARLQEDAKSKQRLALIATGVGAAALVTGAVVLAVHGKKTPVQLSLAPDQAMLVVGGRF